MTRLCLQVFPLQVAPKCKVESQHQHLCGGCLLARIHLSGGVLWKDRPQASENITRETKLAQCAALRSNRQEVLLHPLSLHRLFCTLSRGQGVLHKNPDHRHFMFLAGCGRQS